MKNTASLAVIALLGAFQTSFSQSCPVVPSGTVGGYISAIKSEVPTWQDSPVFAAVIQDIEAKKGTDYTAAALSDPKNRARVDEKIDHATALHLSAGYCRADLVGMLLDAGANPGTTIDQDRTPYYVGMTPLHLAAFHGCFESLDVFLDRGIVSDVPDFAGNTPMMELFAHLQRDRGNDQDTPAAYAEVDRLLKKFRSAGAQIGAVNCAERGLLELAVESSNDALFTTVLSMGAQEAHDDPAWDILYHAIDFGNAAAVEHFLEPLTTERVNHRGPRKKVYRGPGYLHLATDKPRSPSSVRIIGMLLAKGADPFEPRDRESYDIRTRGVRLPKNVREDILYDHHDEYQVAEYVPYVIKTLKLLSQRHDSDEPFLAYARALLPLASKKKPSRSDYYVSGYEFLLKVIAAFERK